MALEVDEMKEFLKSKGWSTWYNPNYWVHPKTISDPESQDYTNYGLPLELAYRFETTSHEPFKPMFMADLMGSGGVRSMMKEVENGT